MKNQKSKIAILILNQSPISAVFQIVRFPGDQKTELIGESQYPDFGFSTFPLLPVSVKNDHLIQSIKLVTGSVISVAQ